MLMTFEDSVSGFWFVDEMRGRLGIVWRSANKHC